MNYPEYAEIKGKLYKIDTDYRTALRCFDVIDDKDITDYERGLAIVYLLFDFVPKKDFDIFLEKARMFLECNSNKVDNKNKEKDMDFNKDRSFINASFMSDYHMNITQERLHFWYFIELIEGLKDDCILNKIRYIRNVDLSEITDKKVRNKIKEAKKFFSLKENTDKPNEQEKQSAIEFIKLLKNRKE